MKRQTTLLMFMLTLAQPSLAAKGPGTWDDWINKRCWLTGDPLPGYSVSRDGTRIETNAERKTEDDAWAQREREAEATATREQERQAKEQREALYRAAGGGDECPPTDEEVKKYANAPNETIPPDGKKKNRQWVEKQRQAAKTAVEAARQTLAGHAWGWATMSFFGNANPLPIWGAIQGIAVDVVLIGTWVAHCNAEYTDACNFQTLQDGFMASETFQTVIKYEYIEAGLKPLLKVGLVTPIGKRVAALASSVFKRIGERVLQVLTSIAKSILTRLMPKYAAKVFAQAVVEEGGEVAVQRGFQTWLPIIGALVGATIGLAFMRHTCGTVNVTFRDKYLKDIDSYFDALLWAIDPDAQ